MCLLLGALILAIILKIWQINFKQVKWSAILSYGFALAGMNLLFYLSIDCLPLGIAVSFEFIGPLSVALFAARQKFDFIWVGLAILGLILLFPFDQAAQRLDPIGTCLRPRCRCLLGTLYRGRSKTLRCFRQSYRLFRHVCRHVYLDADCTLCRDAGTGL